MFVHNAYSISTCIRCENVLQKEMRCSSQLACLLHLNTLKVLTRIIYTARTHRTSVMFHIWIIVPFVNFYVSIYLCYPVHCVQSTLDHLNTTIQAKTTPNGRTLPRYQVMVMVLKMRKYIWWPTVRELSSSMHLYSATYVHVTILYLNS